MIEEKNNHICFYALIVVLMILMTAKYVFQVDIPKLVLSFILIVIAGLGNNEEIISIIISCMILDYSINSFVAITVCTIIYFLKNLNKFKLGLPSLLMIIMFIWELLHCFYVDFNIISVFASMMPLVVLVVIISTDVRNIDYSLVVRILAFVLISVCVIQIGSLVAFNGIDFINFQRLGTFKEDETMIGTEINPNTLGIISVLVITGLFQFRFIGEHSKYDIISTAIILLFGILTSSRTFFVCFILMLGLFILGQTGGMMQKIKTSIYILFAFLFAIFLEALILPETLEFFVNRFYVSDITSGRDVLMSDYHNYITNNIDVMIFGVGLNNFKEKILSIYNVSTHVPHNSIQEIIVAWGFLGLMIMCFLLLLMIIESKRYVRKKNVINYIPLLIILLKSMAGQLLTSGYSILALSFAYLSLCQDFSKRNCSNKNYTL